MNHKINKRKLNRTSSHRGAMLSNMACSLITHGQIRTTLPKAKTLRPIVEKLITKSKKKSNANYSLLLSKLKSGDVVNKLFNEIAKRYLERPGGYLRVLKHGFRSGDNAPMAIIQFV